MKWYKKQIDEKMKKKVSSENNSPATPSSPKPKLQKVIRHGLEKRSRPKTDSIS